MVAKEIYRVYYALKGSHKMSTNRQLLIKEIISNLSDDEIQFMIHDFGYDQVKHYYRLHLACINKYDETEIDLYFLKNLNAFLNAVKKNNKIMKLQNKTVHDVSFYEKYYKEEKGKYDMHQKTRREQINRQESRT